MIMIGSLKKLASGAAVAKPLEGGNKMRDPGICFIGAFVAAVHQQDQMNVVWHDHIFIQPDTHRLIGGQELIFHQFAQGGQLHLRGVEDAAPYGISLSSPWPAGRGGPGLP